MPNQTGIAWRNKDGLWLVIDSRRTHTKFNDACSFSSNIQEATVIYHLSCHIRQQFQDLKPVEVIVQRNVFINKSKG